jgi:hypothetical protein
VFLVLAIFLSTSFWRIMSYEQKNGAPRSFFWDTSACRQFFLFPFPFPFLPFPVIYCFKQCLLAKTGCWAGQQMHHTLHTGHGAFISICLRVFIV